MCKNIYFISDLFCKENINESIRQRPTSRSEECFPKTFFMSFCCNVRSIFFKSLVSNFNATLFTEQSKKFVKYIGLG